MWDAPTRLSCLRLSFRTFYEEVVSPCITFFFPCHQCQLCPPYTICASHEKSIETYGGELPTVGSRVEFSTAPDNQKPDKLMAVNLVTLVPGTGGTGMGPNGMSMPNKRQNTGKE